MKLEHLDEAGAPCTKHVANLDALLVWATIGSRASSFNHDIASKLQGMMMALDEIGGILERVSDRDLARATETAQGALAETRTLLAANRALTRTSTKTRTALRDLVTAAADRVGVGIIGDAGDAQVETIVPLLAQGIALALDALAGIGRDCAVEVIADGDRAKLTFSSTATEPTTAVAEALAIATFVVERSGGELRCGDGRVIVHLPIVA